MNTKEKIFLIEGDFYAEEAREILLDVFSVCLQTNLDKRVKILRDAF